MKSEAGVTQYIGLLDHDYPRILGALRKLDQEWEETDEMVIIQGIKFYNIEETAGLLGITPRTLQRWTGGDERGRPKHISVLRPVAAPNGRKLFKEEDILSAVSHCLEVNLSAESLSDIRKLSEA